MTERKTDRWGRQVTGSEVFLDAHSGENPAHFGPGPEGAHLDQRDGPAGEVGDLPDGAILDLEEGQDEPPSGGKLRKDLGHKRPGRVGVVRGGTLGGAMSLQPGDLVFGQLRERGLTLATSGTEVVVAGADADAE